MGALSKSDRYRATCNVCVLLFVCVVHNYDLLNCISSYIVALFYIVMISFQLSVYAVYMPYFLHEVCVLDRAR